MSTKRIKLWVGLIVILAAIGTLIYSATKSNVTYYMKPSEVLTKAKTDGKSLYGERIRVGGIVVNDTVQGGAIAKKWRFIVTDEAPDGKIRPVALKAATPDKTFKVVYRGIVPDTFKEGVMAIMDGKYNAKGVFVADNLLAKCPSKYEQAEKEGKTARAKTTTQ